jgi:hypothetical protein
MYYSFTLFVANDTHVVLADSNYLYSQPVLELVSTVLSRLNKHLNGLGARRVFVRDNQGSFKELKHDHGCYLGVREISKAQQYHFAQMIEEHAILDAELITNLPEDA